MGIAPTMLAVIATKTAAAPFSAWTPASTLDVECVDVCYAADQGKFVAVGSTNVVATSSDGVTWVSGAGSTPGANWSRIAYGNGLFIAISTEANLGMTSPDGVTWTAKTFPIGWGYPEDIIYGGGVFAMAVDGGWTYALVTTADAETWSPVTTPTPVIARAGFGNGLHYIVTPGYSTESTTVYRTSDFTTWYPSTTPVLLPDNYSSNILTTYGDGYYFVSVLQGNSAIFRSPDLVTWTKPILGTGTFDSITAIGTGAGYALGASRFGFVSYYVTGPIDAAYLPRKDFVDADIAAAAWRGIACSPSRCVMVGYSTVAGKRAVYSNL